MKKITILIISLLSISTLNIKAMEQTLHTIDDVPAYYTNLTKQLFEQPLLDHPAFGPCKVLTMQCNFDDHSKNNFDDNTICCSLRRNVTYFEKSSIIHFSKLSNDAKEISIIIRFGNNHEMHPLENLEIEYQEIIKNLKNNWKATTLKKHPNISHKKSEYKYYLFIKNNCLIQEDQLSTVLVKRFGLNDNIARFQCHKQTGGSGAKVRKFISLWVKKNDFNQFQSIFRLNIKDDAAARLAKFIGGKKEDENLPYGPFPMDLAKIIALIRYGCDESGSPYFEEQLN